MMLTTTRRFYLTLEVLYFLLILLQSVSETITFCGRLGAFASLFFQLLFQTGNLITQISQGCSTLCLSLLRDGQLFFQSSTTVANGLVLTVAWDLSSDSTRFSR